MTIQLDSDLPRSISRHNDLLRQMTDHPHYYLEETSRTDWPSLVLKNIDGDVLDEVPLTVETLQALIDLMTGGALERHYFPGEDRRVAYRLSGRSASSQQPARKQRRRA